MGNGSPGYFGGDRFHGGVGFWSTTSDAGLLGSTDATGWAAGMSGTVDYEYRESILGDMTQCKFSRIPSIEKADGRSKRGDAYHQFLKRRKNRSERRRARENPECIPAYGRYKGYET